MQCAQLPPAGANAGYAKKGKLYNMLDDGLEKTVDAMIAERCRQFAPRPLPTPRQPPSSAMSPRFAIRSLFLMIINDPDALSAKDNMQYI